MRQALDEALANGVAHHANNGDRPGCPPGRCCRRNTRNQKHVDGKPQYSPPIGPLAPAKFTGSVYLVTGNRPAPECNNFSASLENSTGTYVRTVAPNGAGTSDGMLGYMFWAAECQGTRTVCTTPPNTCEGGVGTGAKTYSIPIPMPALRQN